MAISVGDIELGVKVIDAEAKKKVKDIEKAITSLTEKAGDLHFGIDKNNSAFKTVSTLTQRVRALSDGFKNIRVGDIATRLSETDGITGRIAKKVIDISGRIRNVGTSIRNVITNTRQGNTETKKTDSFYQRIVERVKQLRTRLRESTTQQGNFNNRVKEAQNAMAGVIAKVTALYMGIKTAISGVQQLTRTSDEMSSINARLGLAIDESEDLKKVQDQIYAAAQNSRAEYATMVDSVASLKMMTGDAFQSTEEAVKFAELLNKQFKLAGASTEASSAAMYQLNQALASGRLQGDEFRSIMENAPLLAQSIAKELGVSTGELRKMAGEGLLTADVIKNAVYSSAEETEKKFAELPKTFSDVMTSIGNRVTVAFQPIWTELSKFANSEEFQNLMSGMVNIAVAGGGLILNVIRGIAGAITWMQQNWSTLLPIIKAVTTAIILFGGALLAAKTIMGIYNGVLLIGTTAMNIYKAASLLAGGVVKLVNGIVSVATTVWKLMTGAINLSSAASAIFGTTTMVALSPIILIIGAIILLIYGVVQIFNMCTGSMVSGTGVIVGTITGALAVIGNLFIFVINSILKILEVFVNAVIAIIWGIQVAWDLVWKTVANLVIEVAEFMINNWSQVITKLKNIWGTLGTFIGTAFKSIAQGAASATTAIANTFISAANAAIGAINSIIDAINLIPGINLGHMGKIGNVNIQANTGLIDAYLGKMNEFKNAEYQAVKLNRFEYNETAGPEWWSAPQLDYIDVGGAFDFGYGIGEGIDNAVGGVVGGIFGGLTSWMDGGTLDGQTTDQLLPDVDANTIDASKFVGAGSGITNANNDIASSASGATSAIKDTGSTLDDTNDTLEDTEDIISKISDKFTSLRDGIKDAATSFEAMTYKVVNQNKLLANSSKNLAMTYQYTANLARLMGNSSLSSTSKDIITQLGVEDLGTINALLKMSPDQLALWDRQNVMKYQLASGAAAQTGAVVNMSVEISEAQDAEQIAQTIYSKLKKL